MFDLTGRTAFITGAGQGLGAQIARTLSSQGAAVILNDLFAERADAVAEELRAAGGRATTAIADISDLEALRAAKDDAESAIGSGVDILVNNAGIPAGGMTLERFLDTDPATWHRQVDLNGYGTFNTCYVMLPGMIERGWGRVITIVSEGGRIGDPGVAVYGAAKAMGMAFMKSLANEYSRFGVNCNSISLGTFGAPGAFSEEAQAKMARNYATKRLGTWTDIAPAVLWLASEEAGWVTGQTIPVNGGYATS
ncbi:MAG: SDR family NAD(P)-dependent oxidoreductase [Actinomycetota bacterium]|nr:SDR family NAD(P)-dependent oxidoreductase [Actinomycetota bacterium]MDP2289477.1 SDR family NAD(P)-dependent oxidoreductase [Actinomycetota bacterium]